MSEPPSDGTQQPNPDPRPSGQDPDESTAQIYSDPTAPIQDAPPAPPVTPPPPGASYPGSRTAGPQMPSPAVPPSSNPYAQQPPPPPYTQPTDQYGHPADPYGQPQPGQQSPAYGQPYYGTGQTTQTNVSAIILTIVSGISMLGSAFFVGVPSLIFGIMALTSNESDPVGSRKKAKTGWIVYAVNLVLVVVLAIIIGVIALIAFNNGGGDFSTIDPNPNL